MIRETAHPQNPRDSRPLFEDQVSEVQRDTGGSCWHSVTWRSAKGWWHVLLPQANIMPQVPRFVFPNLELSKIKSNNDLWSFSTQAIFDAIGVNIPLANWSSRLNIQHHFRMISFVDHQGPPSELSGSLHNIFVYETVHKRFFARQKALQSCPHWTRSWRVVRISRPALERKPKWSQSFFSVSKVTLKHQC